MPDQKPAIERRKDAIVDPITGHVTARSECVQPTVTRFSRRRVLQWGKRNRMIDDGGVYIAEPAMIERKRDALVSPITGSEVNGGHDMGQSPFDRPQPVTTCRRRQCHLSQNGPRLNIITGQIMTSGGSESQEDDGCSDGDEEEDDDDDVSGTGEATSSERE